MPGFTLLHVLGATLVLAATGGPGAVDAAAKPLLAMAAAHRAPAEIWCNFAGNAAWVRYPTEADYTARWKRVSNGPLGGGSQVVRVYRSGSDTYVTTDPAIHTSIDESATEFYQNGKLARFVAISKAYNGYYELKRVAYYTPAGATMSDVTTKTTFAPADNTFAHPLKSVPGNASDLYIPVYKTLSAFPFKL